VSELSVGRYTTCVIKQADGTPRCWGTPSIVGNAAQPIRMTGLANGGNSACALLEDEGANDGVVICWGENQQGQLILPQDASGAGNHSVAVGFRHACVLQGFGGSISCTDNWLTRGYPLGGGAN